MKSSKVPSSAANRSGTAWAGRFADTIPGYGVRIYGWLPQKLVAGRGL